MRVPREYVRDAERVERRAQAELAAVEAAVARGEGPARAEAAAAPPTAADAEPDGGDDDDDDDAKGGGEAADAAEAGAEAAAAGGEEPWLLLNDFLVEWTIVDDARAFALSWKHPCLVLYRAIDAEDEAARRAAAPPAASAAASPASRAAASPAAAAAALVRARRAPPARARARAPARGAGVPAAVFLTPSLAQPQPSLARLPAPGCPDAATSSRSTRSSSRSSSPTARCAPTARAR